jgi:hypothetical protein
MRGYEERAERARELVVEAWALVAEACRSPCAREECEGFEDVLGAAMDEAEEAARLPGPWLSIPHVGEASRRLEEAARRLRERGCLEEAGLLEEAARRLAMADALGG